MLYLLLLISASGAIKNDRPSNLSSALSFLHRDFKARMYGWEIAEQFKKLFLVGIMVRRALPRPTPPYPAVLAAAFPTPSLY